MSAGAPDPTSADGAVPAGRPADVRLVTGRLADDELAAIAVVVSAMSVTSRLEAEERLLAEGRGPGASAWNDAAHSLPRGHRQRTHASATAWQFSDR